MKRNTSFSDDVARLGHTWVFNKELGEDATGKAESESPNHDHEKREESDEKAAEEVEEPKGPLNRSENSEYAELDEIVMEACSIAEPIAKAIIPWLTGVYESSRGFELGTFDTTVLPIVW